MGTSRAWRPLRRIAAAGGGAAVVTAALCAVIPEPAGASTTPLLSGHVVDSSGRVDRGMTVQVEAWPTGAVLDKLADGASVPTKIVQTVHPDSSGNYAISPDLSGLGARYIEPGGTVNLDVTTTDTSADRNSESYSFTAARPGSRAAAENPLVATPARPQHLGFDLARSTLSAALGDVPLTSQRTANTASATGTPISTTSASRQAAPPFLGCVAGWKKIKSYPKRVEHFMDLWTVGGARVDESVGSSHSLGVGVAVTGGGWSASGSVTIETHSSAGQENSYTRNYALQNRVNYGHYGQTCFKRGKHGARVKYLNHRVRATSMHALQTGQVAIKDHVWGTTTASWKSRCDISNGGVFHKTRGSNITFEAGVNAPFISLSAHAAYSTDTTVYWGTPKAGRTWMCGSTAKGPAQAPYAGEDKNPGPSVGGCGAQCNVVTDAGRDD